MFTPFAGILKRHYILINLIIYKKVYGQMIDRDANFVHGTIGMMGCCNNGLGSLGVNIFL